MMLKISEEARTVKMFGTELVLVFEMKGVYDPNNPKPKSRYISMFNYLNRVDVGLSKIGSRHIFTNVFCTKLLGYHKGSDLSGKPEREIEINYFLIYNPLHAIERLVVFTNRWYGVFEGNIKVPFDRLVGIGSMGKFIIHS